RLVPNSEWKYAASPSSRGTRTRKRERTSGPTGSIGAAGYRVFLMMAPNPDSPPPNPPPDRSPLRVLRSRSRGFAAPVFFFAPRLAALFLAMVSLLIGVELGGHYAVRSAGPLTRPGGNDALHVSQRRGP